MPERRDRDEKTVVIGAGLGLFVLITAVGELLLWIGRSSFGWSGAGTDAFYLPLIALAACATVGYLARSRHPSPPCRRDRAAG